MKKKKKEEKARERKSGREGMGRGFVYLRHLFFLRYWRTFRAYKESANWRNYGWDMWEHLGGYGGSAISGPGVGREYIWHARTLTYLVPWHIHTHIRMYIPTHAAYKGLEGGFFKPVEEPWVRGGPPISNTNLLNHLHFISSQMRNLLESLVKAGGISACRRGSASERFWA